MGFAELFPFPREFLVGGGNGKIPAMYLDNEELHGLSVLETFLIQSHHIDIFFEFQIKGPR